MKKQSTQVNPLGTKLFALAILTASFGNTATAQQKVNDGTIPATAINANAIADYQTNNRGILLPRVALTATTAATPLTAHVAGMYVYNTATAGDVTPGAYFNDGTKWVQTAGGAAASDWHITGNVGTTPPVTIGNGPGATNFWGTTDAKNLAVVTNNATRAIFDQKGVLAGGGGMNINNMTGTNSIVWGSSNTLTGNQSLAIGENNVDSANFTLVSGQLNIIRSGANHSVVSGLSNILTTTAIRSLVSGNGNIVDAANSLVTGRVNTVSATGGFSAISGNNNNVTGGYCLVSGDSNIVSGQRSAVSGLGNTVSGQYNLVGGSTNASAGNYSFVTGRDNTLTAAAANSVAMGHNVTVSTLSTFGARFDNGYRFETNNAGTTGVVLAAGGTAWASISDRRSKENIRNLSYGLKTVMALRPAMYRYKGQSTNSIGFIAQEVQELVPEAVVQTNIGPEHNYLGVTYTELVPVLTKAIQEQQKQIEVLQEEVRLLKKMKQ